MAPSAVVDTGPLVAFLDRREAHHKWAVEKFRELAPPLLLCEAVLTEALFLLSEHPVGCDRLLDMIETGALRLEFSVKEDLAPVRKLLAKYRNLPMSLADACVVRMAELNDSHAVLTLDSDFRTYRKNSREMLTLLAPFSK